jgi:aspartokinase/homoserine dehydrogenase 1
LEAPRELGAGFLILGLVFNLWRFFVTTSFAPLSTVAPILSRSAAKKTKDLALIVIGAGHVGSALLDQLNIHPSAAAGDLRVCAIANSRKWVWHKQGVKLPTWNDRLRSSTDRTDIEELIQLVRDLRGENPVVVDCTASDVIVEAYGRFIDAGAHIVTPNKKANCLPWPRYRSLLDEFARNDRRFLFATNVGAGLPILSTLSDLLASGDTVHRIEGMFSGTLSYLFNRFDGSQPFSALLRDAQKLGYTEPDPRVDLSGGDVAAKLLVLVRQMGWKLDLKDVRVENLWSNRLDASMARRYTAAVKKGSVLRYVGRIADGSVTAQLESLPSTHAFANTRHTDNIVAFQTRRYKDSPLVIQGPGAGPEVTAAGVLADLLRLSRL